MANKIKKSDNPHRKTTVSVPFLVLSELNFPFIINLNNKHNAHLYHHLIISSTKRRS